MNMCKLIVFIYVAIIICYIGAGQPQPKDPPRGPLIQGAQGTNQQNILASRLNVPQPLQQSQRPISLIGGEIDHDLSTEEKAALDYLLQANLDSGSFEREGRSQHFATVFAQANSPTGVVSPMAPAVSAVARVGSPVGLVASAGALAPASSTPGGAASIAKAPAPAPPAILNRQTESDILNAISNRTWNPRSTALGVTVQAPPYFPFTIHGNLIPDNDVQMDVGSTLVEGIGGLSGLGGQNTRVIPGTRVGYLPRTEMVYSEQQILSSCPSQAVRLVLGPCGPAIPSIAPFAHGVAISDCKIVAQAVKVAGRFITPQCCPDLRKFIMDGCNCDSVAQGLAGVVGVSNDVLVAAARAGMVSMCATPAYGGFFSSPCPNIRLCTAWQAFQVVNVTAPSKAPSIAPARAPSGILAPSLALSPSGTAFAARSPSSIAPVASAMAPAMPRTTISQAPSGAFPLITSAPSLSPAAG
eukprot:jgi/Botrbrau1/9256/Bobra.180_1s0014.2